MVGNRITTSPPTGTGEGVVAVTRRLLEEAVLRRRSGVLRLDDEPQFARFKQPTSEPSTTYRLKGRSANPLSLMLAEEVDGLFQ